MFTIISILFLKFNVQAKTELPPADIGWANVNNGWYSYTSQNKKAVGWLNVNNNSYYLQNDEKMKIGLLNNDNTYYYLNDSGSMATNTTIDDWIIDSNGIGMKNNVIIDKDASEKKDRTITNKGIKFIADYEGYSASAYIGQDVQNKTIGYGHVIQPDENFTSLTESQAEDLLNNDLTNYVNGVNSLTNQIDLNNNQFDSLVSFSYNCGLHAFAESQLLKDIKTNASSKILKDDFCNYIHIIDKDGTSVKSLGL